MNARITALKDELQKEVAAWANEEEFPFALSSAVQIFARVTDVIAEEVAPEPPETEFKQMPSTETLALDRELLGGAYDA